MDGRILIVEDEPASLKLAHLVLTAEGYEVTKAEAAGHAVEEILRSEPEAILLDLELPGIDGLTVTRLLKADPRTAQTPIVALSARAMVGDEKEAMEAGCSGYITKPIEVKNFVTTVTEYLEAQGA